MSDSPAVPPDDDASRADVGLVCALSMELNHFFDRCEKVRTLSGGGFRFRGGRLDGIRIAAVESGPGLVKAARATQALLDGHRPAWIIACGFAGSIADDVKVGDIVVANRLHTSGTPPIDVPHGMASDPARRLHVGGLVSTGGVVRTVSEKRSLADATGAVACDMESHAVADVCRDARIPMMVVRSITDDLSADLPVEVHALLETTGAGRLGAAVGALWNRPESVKDLWKLRENAATAARNLAQFLPGVVRQLHKATP